ncbi:hypothetical protein ATK36_6345 [Amycolatopsis sulphurea]|uniref:WXG100 family type VII secretion target n=1 Tax=Amycolatopsis sulphurea TaxID=76022 RepID=A0A2A9FKJ0_9PSEU|nr:hypothetical protein [Amycolatopsis sulphurea]PFG51072.1 hypothetical protein ATK36_6345 [Amycolatopsis sulphurea]
MTSQTINKHNKAKYTEFELALDQVRAAFDELAKLGKGLNERGGGDRFEGWQVPGRSEVQSSIRGASASLDSLRAAATKRKAELISRGWRV